MTQEIINKYIRCTAETPGAMMVWKKSIELFISGCDGGMLFFSLFFFFFYAVMDAESGKSSEVVGLVITGLNSRDVEFEGGSGVKSNGWLYTKQSCSPVLAADSVSRLHRESPPKKKGWFQT